MTRVMNEVLHLAHLLLAQVMNEVLHLAKLTDCPGGVHLAGVQSPVKPAEVNSVPWLEFCEP